MQNGHKGFITRVFLIIAVIVTTGGCIVTHCGCNQSQNYTASKQMTVSGQCRTAEKIVSNLTHTDLNITGVESEQCTVQAAITVHAETQQIADEVCEQIEIQVLDGQPNMTVAVIRPNPDTYKDKYSVSAKMDITAPLDKQLDFTTTHGDCRITNFQKSVNIRSTHGDFNIEQIGGDIHAASTHGNITVSHANNNCVDVITSHGKITLNTLNTQSVKLQTTHDPIILEQVTADTFNANTTHDPIRLSQCKVADAQLHTTHAQITGDLEGTNRLVASATHGSINLCCNDQTNPDMRADLSTTHANIEFTPPADFAGSVNLSTTHGNIKTDRKIVVQGTVSEDHLSGNIGQGQGAINLRSTHGKLILK